MAGYYWHAGVEHGHTVVWSEHTRRSYARAVREARALARAGGVPLVEWWDRAHGLRPGDCEVRAGAKYVGVV